MPLIELNKLSKSYQFASTSTTVLHEIDLQIGHGERVAIMGASGSGKSTLMNILGLLDRPTSGQYFLNDQAVADLAEDDRALLRNRTIGFVFQAFFLLPRQTILQNVLLPMQYRPADKEASLQRAHLMLEKVGLAHLAQHKPNQLSGGQQQRVAIARALVGKPAIILADEPTGALDSQTGQQIMALFHELNQQENMTIIIVTHDSQIAQQCQRIVQIQDGEVRED